MPCNGVDTRISKAVRHSPELLERIANELKALFRVDCPIKFVSDLGARGMYYFRLREIRVWTGQNVLEIIETIAHEIVHYKQQALGTLVAIAPGHFRYKGKDYINVPYKQQPWETEANYHMKRMFQHFCDKASITLLKEIKSLV